MIDTLSLSMKIFAFLFGSCIGSFLNVCIHRLPQEKSIIKPRSHCPKCNTTIKWYDNIPLLSYLLLGGKCRKCSVKIPIRYPLVELITSILIGVLYLFFGWSLLWIEFSVFFSLLILVSFIDIDYHAIPVYLCVVGIAIGLVFAFFKSGSIVNIVVDFLRIFNFSQAQNITRAPTPFFNSTIGLLFGLGFTYLFKLFGDVFLSVYLSIRKKDSIEGEKEAMGLGDVDFMGMVGVFLGWKAVIPVFFIAPLFGVVYSVFALIFKKSHLMPYLPYLSLSTLTIFFWGDKILNFLF